jgi:transposase-like protein
MTIKQEILDLTRAALPYFGTRLCSSALRWVARWNERTLTESDGARIIVALKDLQILRTENAQLRADLKSLEKGGIH